MEAMLPVELEIPSLRVLLENGINEVEWLQSRHDELSLLDERRLKAMEHTRAYQTRMARAFDKKVKIRDIREGNLVLKEKPPTQTNPLGIDPSIVIYFSVIYNSGPFDPSNVIYISRNFTTPSRFGSSIVINYLDFARG